MMIIPILWIRNLRWWGIKYLRRLHPAACGRLKFHIHSHQDSIKMSCCPPPPQLLLEVWVAEGLTGAASAEWPFYYRVCWPLIEFKVKPTGPHMISHGFPCSVLESYRPYNRQAQCASWFKETLRSGGKWVALGPLMWSDPVFRKYPGS